MSFGEMRVNITAQCEDLEIINALVESVKGTKRDVEFLVTRIENQEKLISKLVDSLVFNTNVAVGDKE